MSIALRSFELAAAEGMSPPAINAAKTMLADISELAPSIAGRASDIESWRRLPPDLVNVLRKIGVFRLFAPRSHGGFEFDLPTGLDIIRTLSRIEGSVGWCAMIANGGNLFAPLVRRKTYDQVYSNGPDVIFAGSATPAGTAEAVPGGWRVTGRWPFASGCQHADWMMGICIMTQDGKPLPGPAGDAGPPLMQGVALPAQAWTIEDTWHVAGLKGTGSHHIVLKDVVVPDENVLDFPNGMPCISGPLYQSVQHLLPILHGAVAVGIAEAALDDLIAVAKSGRQQMRAPAPMRESEFFQAELGRLGADLRAAQAFRHAQTEETWRHCLAGTLQDDSRLAEVSQAAVWLVSTCVRIADACFTLAGGSALYETSPLQRRMRDLHVAAQHAVAQQRQYVAAGKHLLGLPLTPPKSAAR